MNDRRRTPFDIRRRLRLEAEQDRAESARWYEDQRLGSGQEFLDEALATIAAIADPPLANAAVTGDYVAPFCTDFPSAFFTSWTTPNSRDRRHSWQPPSASVEEPHVGQFS